MYKSLDISKAFKVFFAEKHRITFHFFIFYGKLENFPSNIEIKFSRKESQKVC